MEKKKNQFAIQLITNFFDENSTVIKAFDEIDMAIMTQFRAAYRLLSCDDYNRELVVELLFVALENWDRLDRDITRSIRGYDGPPPPLRAIWEAQNVESDKEQRPCVNG